MVAQLQHTLAFHPMSGSTAFRGGRRFNFQRSDACFELKLITGQNRASRDEMGHTLTRDNQTDVPIQSV